jgi:ABC-type antimicrobial peptide transport system permease subunit
MGVRLLEGRLFDARDTAGQPPVVVVNRALARRAFPRGSAIGETVYLDWHKAEPWTVVGVVDDMRQEALSRAPEPQVFIDIRQWPDVPPGFSVLQYFVVRAVNGSPATLLPAIRDVVRAIEPAAAIYHVAPMDRIVANSIARPRMHTVLLGLFAGLAAVLAAVGIYGVTAYAVAQRRREIGLRLALGARRSQILVLVLRQSVTLIGVGLVAGLGLALATTRVLTALLYDVRPLDVATFAIVSIGFATVAIVASIVPARRAMNVNPMVTLRDE